MRAKEFYTYIVTNPNRKVLYTGVTNNLQKRVVDHYLNRGSKETFVTVLFGMVLFLLHMKLLNVKST